MTDQIERAPRGRRSNRLWLHLVLFLATCCTTTWAGIRYAHPQIGWLNFDQLFTEVLDGLPFSISIMTILVAHEMGHYLLARRHGMNASLPFFLPVPLPMVGTMGAVIVMKGGIPSRNGLVDFAAAGPLAGLLVAVPVLAYGIHLSPVLPTGPGLLEGNSFLYLAIKYLIKGAILPGGGMDVRLNPMAWAGWVGLLVTMINMIPIGQLDGGHIAYAYFDRRHNSISAWLHRLLPAIGVVASAYTVLDLSRKAPALTALALGWSAGMSWIIWWGMLKGMLRLSRGQYHPPVGEDALTPGRRRLCIAMMVVFVAIFMPIWMRVTL